MDLTTIEMERPKAREAFLDYRRALREKASEVDAEIMRGYRELARGRQLIRLSETIRAGGVELYEFGQGKGRPKFRVLAPRLAVCRATAERCYTNGVEPHGRAEFRSRPGRELAPHNRRDRVRIDGLEDPGDLAADSWTWSGRELVAVAPIVPPRLRPERGIAQMHLLFEAEWARHTPPAPVDPALIRHIGGDLWAVLAIWDLTPLERAVLEGRG